VTESRASARIVFDRLEWVGRSLWARLSPPTATSDQLGHHPSFWAEDYTGEWRWRGLLIGV